MQELVQGENQVAISVGKVEWWQDPHQVDWRFPSSQRRLTEAEEPPGYVVMAGQRQKQRDGLINQLVNEVELLSTGRTMER